MTASPGAWLRGLSRSSSSAGCISAVTCTIPPQARGVPRRVRIDRSVVFDPPSAVLVALASVPLLFSSSPSECRHELVTLETELVGLESPPLGQLGLPTTWLPRRRFRRIDSDARIVEGWSIPRREAGRGSRVAQNAPSADTGTSSPEAVFYERELSVCRGAPADSVRRVVAPDCHLRNHPAPAGCPGRAKAATNP